MKSGVFFPMDRYDLPIINTSVVQPFESTKMVYSQELDDEVEEQSIIPPLMGEGYDVTNMRQLGFPNHVFASPLQEYSINYNCIGWAFNIDLFIEPKFENDDLVTRTLLDNFIKQCRDIYYDTLPEGGVLERFHYIEDDATQSLDYDFSYNFQENDVVFYFGTNAETDAEGYNENVLLHAARYFDVSRSHGGDQDLRWTSKMGDMLLVSHNLMDLIGDTYGDATDMLV